MEYLNAAVFKTPCPVITTTISKALLGFPVTDTEPDSSVTLGSMTETVPSLPGTTGIQIILDAPFSMESITASVSGLNPNLFFI